MKHVARKSLEEISKVVLNEFKLRLGRVCPAFCGQAADNLVVDAYGDEIRLSTWAGGDKTVEVLGSGAHTCKFVLMLREAMPGAVDLITIHRQILLALFICDNMAGPPRPPRLDIATDGSDSIDFGL